LSVIPGVIGYDVINEPWGDEATDLAALHRDAGQAIRTADASAILFLAPHAILSGGFGPTKLPAPPFANAVYAPHFYDGSLLLLNGWNGNLPDAAFQNMRATATAWGVPLFLGEFGGPAVAMNIAGYLDAIHDRLNETFASAAQWAYTPGWTPSAKDGWNTEDFGTVDDTGGLRANFSIRPYARRIAGTPKIMRVTHELLAADNAFELAWDHVPSAGATEIFLPRAAFFGTSDVAVVTEGEGLACVLAPLHLTCTSSVAGAKRVVIRPASPVDGGRSDDEGGAMRDAETSEATVQPPGGASSGGCACTAGAPSSSGGAPIPGVLVGLGIARAVAKRRKTSELTARPPPRP
jgi:endoglycosylceramidase